MDRTARHRALGDRGRRTRRICLQPAGATGRKTTCFLLIIRNGSNWYRCKIWMLIKWSCDTLVGSNVLKWSSHVENGPSVCDAISEIFLTRYISNENNSWKCFIFFNALLIGCVSQTLYILKLWMYFILIGWKCVEFDWMKMYWIWLDDMFLDFDWLTYTFDYSFHWNSSDSLSLPQKADIIILNRRITHFISFLEERQSSLSVKS